jgi:hypothetical protein
MTRPSSARTPYHLPKRTTSTGKINSLFTFMVIETFTDNSVSYDINSTSRKKIFSGDFPPDHTRLEIQKLFKVVSERLWQIIGLLLRFIMFVNNEIKQTVLFTLKMHTNPRGEYTHGWWRSFKPTNTHTHTYQSTVLNNMILTVTVIT